MSQFHIKKDRQIVPQAVIDDLLQALDAARPVMEWMAKESCYSTEDWPCGKCEPCQARAWMKEHYPEEKNEEGK